MTRDIYSKEGFVKTLVEGSTIHVVWEKMFNAQVIYDSCNAQIKAVQNEGCNVVIIDMVNGTGTPPMECQEWFGSHLFPAFKENPEFKALINVLPGGAAITKMGANHWKKTAEASNLGFDVYETHSVDDAKKLIAELQ